VEDVRGLSCGLRQAVQWGRLMTGEAIVCIPCVDRICRSGSRANMRFGYGRDKTRRARRRRWRVECWKLWRPGCWCGELVLRTILYVRVSISWLRKTVQTSSCLLLPLAAEPHVLASGGPRPHLHSYLCVMVC